ncbi:hypothetical protein AAG570_009266 [Ranatra chinensis]|uniref:Uncharacterized protein n=1 Tax=Ranatra chinensis TaxID=642074 RepID=A0ABD0Z638_9HEMI
MVAAMEGGERKDIYLNPMMAPKRASSSKSSQDKTKCQRKMLTSRRSASDQGQYAYVSKGEVPTGLVCRPGGVAVFLAVVFLFVSVVSSSSTSLGACPPSLWLRWEVSRFCGPLTVAPVRPLVHCGVCVSGRKGSTCARHGLGDVEESDFPESVSVWRNTHRAPAMRLSALLSDKKTTTLTNTWKQKVTIKLCRNVRVTFQRVTSNSLEAHPCARWVVSSVEWSSRVRHVRGVESYEWDSCLNCPRALCQSMPGSKDEYWTSRGVVADDWTPVVVGAVLAGCHRTLQTAAFLRNRQQITAPSYRMSLELAGFPTFLVGVLRDHQYSVESTQLKNRFP